MLVAEVSSNHRQDLGRCLEFVETAARIGCDAVKFQLFRLDRLFAPEILAASKDHRQRREWELPVSFIPELAELARRRGLLFSCTAFDLEGVAELVPWVDFLKIASYELLWDELLETCARTGKPVVLSTGMADCGEIDHAVQALRCAGCSDLLLLHCVSGYPTPIQEANLSAIETLRKRYRCPVGWSDHTAQTAVWLRAVHRWQVSLLEFHLDLDGRGPEYAHGHCWLPRDAEKAIRLVRDGLAADGSGAKTPAGAELADRQWRADPADGLRPCRQVRQQWEREARCRQ
ncbi:MAG: N-acetylneuraminate synthase family protein [Acidobacteriota bacterium]